MIRHRVPRRVLSKYGLRGVRIGEASHSWPSRDRSRSRGFHKEELELGSDDEPLICPQPGPEASNPGVSRVLVPSTQPVSGTSPTRADSDRVPPTIIDALEEDLAANTMFSAPAPSASTVAPSSREVQVEGVSVLAQWDSGAEFLVADSRFRVDIVGTESEPIR